MAKPKSARKTGPASAPTKKKAASAPAKAAPKKAVVTKTAAKAKAAPKAAPPKAQASAKANAKKTAPKAKTAPKKVAPAKAAPKKVAPKKGAPPPAKVPAKKVAPAKAAPKTTAPVVKAAPRTIDPNARLSAEQEELLHDLGGGFARPLDRTVDEVLQEARELEAGIAAHTERLVTKTRLSRDVLTSLAERARTLAAAEAAWAARLAAQIPETMRPILDEALGFKRDAIAALRYFCEDDAEVQTRVDSVAPGTGVVALANELLVIAELVQANGATLKRAELPQRAAPHARELSEVLAASATPEAADGSAHGAMDLRNRAFWYLREAMDAVRSAGRYAFRAEPEALVLFRAAPVRAPARERATAHAAE